MLIVWHLQSTIKHAESDWELACTSGKRLVSVTLKCCRDGEWNNYVEGLYTRS